MEDRLTSEEIYLLVDNDKLIKKYNLLDMYTVCQNTTGIIPKYHTCISCKEIKSDSDYTQYKNYRYKSCKKCISKKTKHDRIRKKLVENIKKSKKDTRLKKRLLNSTKNVNTI